MPAPARLTVRLVRSLKPNAVAWDSAVIGFGARRQAGPISFILRYRSNAGRQRTYTIGRYGSPWTPDTARAEAVRLLGEIVQGADPSADKRARRVAVTVADLSDQYLADVESGRLLTRRRRPKTASTLLSDKGRIAGHIRPLLGHLPVAAVTRDDVEQFMHAVAAGATRKRLKLHKVHALSNVRGGRGAATRTVGLFGAMMTYAIRLNMRSDNPVHGVVRYADRQRDRRLRDEEYLALGRGLRAAHDAGDWRPALAVIRFLMITGWRSGEALTLRWMEVDLGRRTARLANTKTGASIRALPDIGCDILRTMPTGEFVFQAPGGDAPMRGFARVWRRVVHRLAGLPKDVTPHVLRHSFASLAADLGYGDATIAGLLGHAGHSITRRYIHSADAALLAAANAVAEETVRMMNREIEQAGVSTVRSDGLSP